MVWGYGGNLLTPNYCMYMEARGDFVWLTFFIDICPKKESTKITVLTKIA